MPDEFILDYLPSALILDFLGDRDRLMMSDFEFANGIRYLTNNFSLSAYFKALMLPNYGYFRVLVFIVSPIPFNQNNKEINKHAAAAWKVEGLNSLPDEIASINTTESHEITVLIYEFEKFQFDDEAKFISFSPYSGREHLIRAGILEGLQ